MKIDLRKKNKISAKEETSSVQIQEKFISLKRFTQ